MPLTLMPYRNGNFVPPTVIKKLHSLESVTSKAPSGWSTYDFMPSGNRPRGKLFWEIFLFLFLFRQYFNTNPKKKVFANLSLLVVPARLVRLHHFVTPHALARQGAPRWHAPLTGADVASVGLALSRQRLRRYRVVAPGGLPRQGHVRYGRPDPFSFLSRSASPSLCAPGRRRHPASPAAPAI